MCSCNFYQACLVKLFLPLTLLIVWESFSLIDYAQQFRVDIHLEKEIKIDFPFVS